MENILEQHAASGDTNFEWDDEVEDPQVAMLESLIFLGHTFTEADFSVAITSPSSLGCEVSKDVRGDMTLIPVDQMPQMLPVHPRVNRPRQKKGNTSTSLEDDDVIYAGLNKLPALNVVHPTAEYQSRVTRSKTNASESNNSKAPEVPQVRSTGCESTVSCMISEFKRWVVERNGILKLDLKKELLAEMDKRFEFRPVSSYEGVNISSQQHIPPDTTPPLRRRRSYKEAEPHNGLPAMGQCTPIAVSGPHDTVRVPYELVGFLSTHFPVLCTIHQLNSHI